MSDPHDREPQRPYHENPSMYEQACLREVMRGLSGLAPEGPDVAPYNIHEVRLEGEYPDTRLVVRLSRLGPPATLEWGLWSDDFGEVPDESNRASPAQVADDVMIQVYEFA